MIIPINHESSKVRRLPWVSLIIMIICIAVHVWGFLFGVSFALIIKHFKIEDKYINKNIESKLETIVAENKIIKEVMNLKNSGNIEQALGLIKNEVLKNTKNLDAFLTYWELSIDLNIEKEAQSAIIKFINENIKVGNVSLAIKYWSEMIEKLPNSPVNPLLAPRVSELCYKENESYKAEEALKFGLKNTNNSTPSGIVLRIARLSCKLRSDIALSALKKAYEHPEIPLNEKEDLKSLQWNMKITI